MNKISKFLYEQMYLLLYIIVIGLGSIASVIVLSRTIDRTTIVSTPSPLDDAKSVDQSVINSLDKLKRSEDVEESPVLPESRINPFSE